MDTSTAEDVDRDTDRFKVLENTFHLRIKVSLDLTGIVGILPDNSLEFLQSSEFLVLVNPGSDIVSNGGDIVFIHWFSDVGIEFRFHVRSLDKVDDDVLDLLMMFISFKESLDIFPGIREKNILKYKINKTNEI